MRKCWIVIEWETDHVFETTNKNILAVFDNLKKAKEYVSCLSIKHKRKTSVEIEIIEFIIK